MMLFLDHVLDSYWVDVVDKVWMSEAWILRSDNRYFFALEFPGNWKIDLFSQKNYKFRNLRNETLAIADKEYVKMSKFVLFNIKLLHIAYLEWMNLNENHKRFEGKSSFLCNH